MILVGTAFPFAEPANATIRGWDTQLATRTSLRIGSQTTVPGVPKLAVAVPCGALRIYRSGATLPSALAEKTVVIWLSQLVTHSSRRFASTKTEVGPPSF